MALSELSPPPVGFGVQTEGKESSERKERPNMHFVRYLPEPPIDPLSLLPLYGMEMGSEEFARKYGPKQLFQDLPHERGSRAIELAIRAVKKSGQEPDIIIVITSHLPYPDKTNPNKQRVANNARIALEQEGLIDKVKVTPENTQTVSAACTGSVVGFDWLHKMNPVDANVLFIVDETNYRETIAPPAVDKDNGKGGLLFSDVGHVMQFVYGPKGLFIPASMIYRDYDSGRLISMRTPEYDKDDSFLTFFRPPYSYFFNMKGPEVAEYFERLFRDGYFDSLYAQVGISESDLMFYYTHQPSMRMVRGNNKRFTNTPHKSLGIREYGNTSAASVTLAIEDGIESGEIKSGDVGITHAFGAGSTHGGNILVFGKAT